MKLNQHTKAQKGQIIIFAVLLLMGISLVMIGSATAAFSGIARDIRLNERSYSSYATAEVLTEDIVYRLIKALPVSNTETLTLNGATATATISGVLGEQFISVVGDKESAVRTLEVVLTPGSGASFNFGVQSGEGGMGITNFASIQGNAFSNGPVEGSNNNIIYGDVISAGPTGVVSGVHATGTIFANTITDSIADGDAWYQNISGTTVGGISHPGSEDQATSSLPIPDTQIDGWKADAEVGGLAVCSGGKYTISDIDSLGPIKVPCDLLIDGSDIVTLTGPVWVVGDITFSNTATVQVDPLQPGKAMSMIADNPAQPMTKGKISISNSVTFSGAGEGSYILLISQNTSAENGGGEVAISVNNTVTGDVLVYAGHGKITLSNNINLHEVTAYRIDINNSAQIVYKTGLANLLFTSGPSGGYVISSWKEI